MANKTEIIHKYAMFNSKYRGEPYIEDLLHNLLLEKESPEKLLKMFNNLTIEWDLRNRNILDTICSVKLTSNKTNKLKMKTRLVSPQTKFIKPKKKTTSYKYNNSKI